MPEHRFDVFISYRRSDSAEVARLLQRCLQDRGLTTFLDVDELGAGHFDDSLLEVIAQAGDFVVILSRDALARCADPNDWLRREIATALRGGKNVVPVLMPGFAFPAPKALPAELAELPRYQSVTYSHEYFAAMLEKLCGYLRSCPAAGRRPPGGATARRARPKTRLNSLGNTLVDVPAALLGGGPPLYVSATAVSNREYRASVKAGGPAPHVHPRYPEQRTWQGDRCPPVMLDHPVVYVTQAEARNFCVWLTKHEQEGGVLDAGEYYTLPTSEQWHAFATGARLTGHSVVERRWIEGQYQPTAPVTWDPAPSPLGLFHVYGNVFEWCLDEDTREVTRPDGKVRVPCYLAAGGGWASARDWLLKGADKGTGGAIWCPYGWIMKDGGFRVCLVSG